MSDISYDPYNAGAGPGNAPTFEQDTSGLNQLPNGVDPSTDPYNPSAGPGQEPGFEQDQVNTPGQFPSTSPIVFHPDYLIKFLVDQVWTLDEYKAIKFVLLRTDQGMIVAPTWAAVKITGPDGTLLANMPLTADIEPNDPTGALCLPAQTQTAAALFQFPAAGKYCIEAVMQVGPDKQKPAASITIIVS